MFTVYIYIYTSTINDWLREKPTENPWINKHKYIEREKEEENIYMMKKHNESYPKSLCAERVLLAHKPHTGTPSTQAILNIFICAIEFMPCIIIW